MKFETIFQTLVGIVLLLQGVVASAALSNDELKTLVKKLDRIDYVNPSGLHELPCEIDAKLKLVHLFAFDGSMGFCPRYYEMNRLRHTREGVKRTYQQELSETRRTPENEALIRSLEKLMANERGFHNCHLIESVLKDMGGKQRAESPLVDVHYYSQNGHREASECAKKINFQIEGAARLRVVAYSMGVDAALQFAQDLSYIQIERVLSIDPVGRGLRWSTGVFTQNDQDFFVRPAQVKRWDNFFQKLDHRSLTKNPYVRLGIRGSRVIGADTNTQLVREEFSPEPRNQYEHVKILKTTPVEFQISDILK